MAEDTEPCCAPSCCAGTDTTVTTLARGAIARGTATTAVTPATLAPSETTLATDGDALRATVRDTYAAAARRAAEGEHASCGCGPSCCAPTGELWDPITSDLYDAGETDGIPAQALLASLGCGNPTALAALVEGETVLDLGSGGGIDVLLSARRVGATGKAYGLDMTDDMLALARQNQSRAGATNVEFLKGEIEHIPLGAESVDVIISNCVINLSADKGQVLREAYRVLRPGGRFAVSDVVLRGDIPDVVRSSVALWTGCVAGALHEDEYRALLEAAGFSGIEIEPTRVYTAEDAQALLGSAGLPFAELLPQVEGKVISAFVRARKPAASSAS